jgi:hypothetical protein
LAGEEAISPKHITLEKVESRVAFFVPLLRFTLIMVVKMPSTPISRVSPLWLR